MAAGVRGAGARALQALALLALGAVTVVLCYLALTRETAADSDLALDEPSSDASDASATPGATDQPSAGETPEPTEPPKVPKVPNQRLADFTKGDDLPDGSVTYDSPGATSRMQLTDAGLTHGPLEDGAPNGLGLVETELESDVRSLGFRVRFPDGASGSAVLVAWESSAVATLEAGDPFPSGMRLAVTAGTWTLSIITGDGEEALADGTYDAATGPLEFRMVRDGDQVFVVDPTGLVTTATKPPADEPLGPFASWGLAETEPAQTPAVIEAVWAG